MKRIICLLALLAAATAFAADPKSPGKVIQQCERGYVWTSQPGQGGEELLLWLVNYDGTRIQVGNFRTWDGQYWGYVDGTRWRKCIEPPIGLPRGYSSTPNFGVQWTPRAADENVLHFGGGKQPDVRKVIKAGGDSSEVPNYNGMWSLTVVSADDGKRKQVVEDLERHPALARWQHERIKDYDPKSPALPPFKLGEDTSFQQTGLVTLVSPPCDGNFKAPLECIYGYAGAEDLASRLRDVEARYNPNVHAGQSHAGSLTPLAAAAVSGLTVGVFCLLVCAAIVVALVLLMRRPAPVSEEEESKS